MTAVSEPGPSPDLLPLERSEVEGRSDIGPLCMFFLRASMLTLPIAYFGAVRAIVRIPGPLYLLLPIAALCLAPRSAILRIQVSISAMLLVVWLALSYMWSIDPRSTFFHLREDLPPVIGVTLVAGMLPLRETVRWLLRAVLLMMAISIVAVVVDPVARSGQGAGGEVTGFQGWFPSKNQFGAAMTISWLTIYTLEPRRAARWVGAGTAAVLVLLSASAAALAGLIVAFGVVTWVRRYQAVGSQWSAAYVLTSLLLGVAAIIGAFVSIDLLVRALGRDITFSGRTAIWNASLDAVGERPVFGYGYNVLFENNAPESVRVIRQVGFEAAHAHNGALDAAVSLGLPGAALFFMLLVSTLILALRHLRHSVVATWVFVFIVLQFMIGAVEPVFLEWLAPLVLVRIMVGKVAIDTKARRAAANRARYAADQERMGSGEWPPPPDVWPTDGTLGATP